MKLNLNAISFFLVEFLAAEISDLLSNALLNSQISEQSVSYTLQ